jgi:heat shock transcription factor
MVNDPSTDDLIHWSADGKSFFVVRHEDFARSVLPRFFKHSNFSSFVRQLNMYGFHKVPHLQNGVLLSDNDSEQWEFSNPHFQRNQPDLLLLVTRKKGRETDEKDGSAAHGNSTSSNGSSNSSHIDLHRILEEIQVIKQHQMNISSQLKSIQSDNSILWQETISARERHQRHQETIDKILRFLASVFSNDKSVAIPRKRRFLLEAPEQDGTMDSRRQEQQDGSHNDDKANERPTKAQKTKPAPEFKLEDYVPGLNGQTGNSSSSSTTQPQNPTSELADAIASNDKSKQSTSSSSSSSCK